MSSPEVDYNALEATTSIEEMTGYELNQNTLRSLKNDELPSLCLYSEGVAMVAGEYELFSSTELGWLGHFMKKSTRLERFGICGLLIFDNCSEQSVDRFLDELGKCNHIQQMNFSGFELDQIIYKLGPAMISNNITHLDVEGCYMGVPEAIFLFNTLRDMSSLEELWISWELDDARGPNDAIMAECIPSLATCTGMRKLTLNDLTLSTNSCAALSGVFPRMSALLELDLGGNLIDDDCARFLAQGLSESIQILSLNLSHNRISDDGLDVLIQGLPESVEALDLGGNEVTLAQQIPLLRLKVLDLWGNILSLDGPRVIAASLANPECRLEELNLNRCNIGDEGAATLAEGLQNNQRLIRMLLAESNIREEGWNAFLPILCDASSINATHGSNHTLQNLGFHRNNPQDVDIMFLA
ncbi:hypothetical protein THAOC_37559 [Thalassiosira oceanica]|uniref:Uncharacterized protein n=1 Tax=Thalassiosira oceanica TaxID=159749 RepID=K0RBP0_THAOC|nr:hypothetical protein THAOC_37559 [Thalassiosira oceanica]|eukprot:EJK43947.1 hypothetical protein THAOC_37559 [Thalassiosira oceanica]